MGAAYSGGEEEIEGSLAPGKLADLAVLSEDIFSAQQAALLATHAVATMVGGEFVYTDGSLL